MLHRLWLLLALLPMMVNADPDTLDYLYSPALAARQDNLLQRVNLLARNENFEGAIELSQTLLDSIEPLEASSPELYGQILVNHGIIQSSAGNYELGLSIISRGLAIMERSTKPFDDKLISALMAQAITELNLERLEEAADTFRRAQHITHRADGVYSERQLIMVNYLTAAHLREGNAQDADLQQLFSLRVAEKNHGPDSLELLTTLSRLGSYFAARGATMPILMNPEVRVMRDILFKRSIQMHDRAIAIIENNYGENDLRLVEPLRALASARMMQLTNRREAEEALLRAQSIVESNPNSDLTDRAQALLDLGDLYVILSDPAAAQAYLDAWQLLDSTPETRHVAVSAFETPLRLFPRRLEKIYLDRLPDSAGEDEPLFVDLEFTVTSEGKVDDIRVIDKNVPNEQVRLLRQRIRSAKYRPRVVDGALISTESFALRQRYQVINRSPQPATVSNSDI